jgi:ferredoxin--NADP+ reductase
MPRIVSSTPLNDRLTAVEVEAPEIVASAEPAQIALTRFTPKSAWVPKPIVDVNRDQGTMTLFFSNAADVSAPDREPEIRGPFGARKAWNNGSKALFVFERDGLGAVLAPLRASKAAGLYTLVIAGFRSQSDIFWADRLNELSDELYVVTEDGSYGIRGPIRHTLRAVCEQTGDIDRTHAAGSLKLLKTTADVTRNFNIPATVSLAAVFDDAAPPAPADAALQTRPGADEAFDWAHANDLDAHTTDFDALARRLGILVTR